jgi:hypothetical protein
MVKRFSPNFWKKQWAMDPEKPTDRSDYWLHNERTNWLKLASELNPFRSELFAYLDYRCLQFSKMNSGDILLKPAVLPSLVLKLNDQMVMLHSNSHSFSDGGAFLAGTSAAIAKWNSSYYNLLQKGASDQRFVGWDYKNAEQTCLLDPTLCFFVPADASQANPWHFLSAGSLDVADLLIPSLHRLTSKWNPILATAATSNVVVDRIPNIKAYLITTKPHSKRCLQAITALVACGFVVELVSPVRLDSAWISQASNTRCMRAKTKECATLSNALTQIYIWRKIVKEKEYEWGAIFEDDVQLAENVNPSDAKRRIQAGKGIAHCLSHCNVYPLMGSRLIS